MKVEISDQMLENPSHHRAEWESLGRQAPKVGARFHDLFSAHRIPKNPAFYREWAKRVIDADLNDADMNLLVALGAEIFERHGLAQYSPHRALVQTVEGHVRQGDSRRLDLPVTRDALGVLLHQCFSLYRPFLEAYEPQCEDDLFDLVSEARFLTEDKKKAVRTKFRKCSHLVEDPMRFLKLDLDWCNEAVFSKLDVEERKLIAKECVLAGISLHGIPLEVYSRGRSKSLWILQSTEWDDTTKIKLLNEHLVLFSAGKSRSRLRGDSFFPSYWSLANVAHASTAYYYGPVLFPEKVTLDLRNSLNHTGKRNLLGYLYVASMKVKVKLTEAEQAKLIGEVRGAPIRAQNISEEEAEKFVVKLKKHFV